MSERVRLPFRIGARTLASVSRRLVRVPLSLADALRGEAPALPPLGAADGWLVTSLPVSAEPALGRGFLVAERQRYHRYWVDLSGDEAAWAAGLSANTRAGLRRKQRKLAAQPGFAITRHATAAEVAAFHAPARAVSATTYQEALLDAGLPAEADGLVALAAADRVRAWLLWLGGRPVAYLAATAEGDTLRYDYVGHDPAHAALSPGSVLQSQALSDLFAEGRFARFDFTEGEGQHKRGLASDGVVCVDLLILRATATNRALLAALAGFDRAVALAKRAATSPAVARVAKRVRR